MIFLAKLSLSIALAAAFGYTLLSYLNTPYLYESYSTRKCAFIELPDGTRQGCEHYDPEQRYIHEWAR